MDPRAVNAWRTFRLGDGLEIKHGFAFKGEYFRTDDGPYIVLTPGNFRDKGGFKAKSGAEKFYDEALRIDPRHRGALEYSGELYLQTGDLARAEQRLAALDKACFLPCAEYSDLKKAIAQYKAGSGTTSSGY